MTNRPIPLAIAICLLSAPAFAVSGGKLGTLERGSYACEMPGDAAIGRGKAVPERDFDITNSSTYASAQGDGIYLRTGDEVTMTSGPRKGERFRVKSESFLREVAADGSETGLRCVRRGSNGA
mgnify:FL=1